MTVQEAIKKYSKIEIELLLQHVLKKPKEFLYLHGEYVIAPYYFDTLSKLIERRKQGEPIAYLLGYKDFYGLRFKVNKHVLIPRPETELIAAHIFNVCKALQITKPIKILDVGTGTGCIIITLASELQKLESKKQKIKLYASDVSQKALAISKQNAIKHKTKIKFIQSDLLTDVKFDPDIIIANLPYLDQAWTDASIKYEPKQALFAQERGLKKIRRLLNQIAAKQIKPQLIYLEFDPRQKLELSKLIKKCLPSFSKRFYKDYNNLFRYVEIYATK